tara:strand:- start:132269 stop:132442 length:174 start_codon:yes stop_codon:yes gene_type:complete
MYNVNNKQLTNATENHVQFCNGLKALIDGGCSLSSLSDVVEELCNQSEEIHRLNTND